MYAQRDSDRLLAVIGAAEDGHHYGVRFRDSQGDEAVAALFDLAADPNVPLDDETASDLAHGIRCELEDYS